MNIKVIILDSSRYAASDWTKFILLGILFILTDFLDKINPENSYGEFIWLIFIPWLILFFIQAGYIFSIIESTVKGENKLPPFHNLKKLFVHGVKDSIIFFIYLFIPLILFIIFIITDIISHLYSPILILIFVIVPILFFILFQGSVLNMAHNNGKLRSAFNIKEIITRIRKAGVQNFIIICFLTGLIIWIVEPLVVDELTDFLDYRLGALIDLFIAPYLTILTSRFLGLTDRC